MTELLNNTWNGLTGCIRFYFLDTPKINGTVAVYTWEGNPANISCEVKAHPSDVSIVWLRDGLQLPNSNTTNIKIFRTPSASFLQVRTPVSHHDLIPLSISLMNVHIRTNTHSEPHVSSRFHEHRLEV